MEQATGNYTCITVIRDSMMLLACPAFQPFTLLSVNRVLISCCGLMALICPVDMLVLSLPRAEMVLESMLLPKLLVRAAEIYRCKGKNLFTSYFSFLRQEVVLCSRFSWCSSYFGT